MSFTVLAQDGSSDFTEKFISLPKHLYSKNEIMQNENDERSLLNGTHILSHYFSLKAFIVTDESGKCISRCAVTIYPDDKTAFLGLFESADDTAAVKELLSAAEEFAKSSGINRIVGPVDASFWIRYRFKTDKFGNPYTGEPYNLPYYPKLWQECGYRICERYSSNHYIKVENQVDSEKFSSRLAEKLASGYSIENVTKNGFNKALKEVYGMLIELYSSFPAYKRINENEFTGLYSYFGSIIRYNMVKMAYFKNKPVGFFISIPDYGNIVYGKLSIADYIKIFRIRSKPSGYVMLYMGVDAEHRGLGKALAEAIRSELKNEGVPSIGALIRDGNINKDYFSSLIDFEYEYILLEKLLDQGK